MAVFLFIKLKMPACNANFPFFSHKESLPISQDKKRKNTGEDRFIRVLSSQQIYNANFHLTNAYEENKKTKLSAVIPINPIAKSHIDPMDAKLRQCLQGKTGLKAKLSFKTDTILDAPNLRHDYYCHLLAKGQSDNVYIALENTTYLYNSQREVQQLSSGHDQRQLISAIEVLHGGSMQTETILEAVSDNHISALDVNEKKTKWCQNCVDLSRATLRGENKNAFWVGSAKGNLTGFDIRQKPPTHSTKVSKQMLCSLAYDGLYYMATGSNDNSVYVYDIRQLSKPPMTRFREHKASVRALSFDSSGDCLLSGGGSHCRHLKLWNLHTGKTKASVDTQNQITSIAWINPAKKVFITSHGFSNSQYALSAWQYSNSTSQQLKKIAEVEDNASFRSRYFDALVLPNSKRVVALSEDETLRFFSVQNCRSHRLVDAVSDTDDTSLLSESARFSYRL